MQLTPPFSWLDGQIAIELPGVRALFTTVSAGNLGLLTGDPAVAENRRRLAEGLGIGLAWRRQVHGNQVHAVSEPTDPEAPWIEADGLMTGVRDLGVLVLAADCLPIVLAAGHRVAALHAGWHGLADGVIANGVEALGSAGPVTAAIGPAAGPCCYEVGDELRERFAGYDAEHGANLDLKRIARRQLEAAGVTEIHDVGLCTICAEPGLFFSHRRDHGNTGRQAGIAWLTS